MDTNLLKSSFWGYSKVSVCEYVAKINEEFSQKLLDAMAEYEQTQKELKNKIEQLEHENEQLRSAQNDVTAILLDAKAFADELHAKAEAEDKKKRAENAARNVAEASRIQRYSMSIDAIRNEIHTLVEAIDMELQQNLTKLSALEEGLHSNDSQIYCEMDAVKDT